MELNAMIMGVSAVSVLLLVIIFNLGENHKWLKLLLFLIVPIIILFIPKLMIDNADYCQVVVNNATVTGDTTSYEYERQCFSIDNNTPQTFFKLNVWTFVLITVYFLAYLIYFFFTDIWRGLKDGMRGLKK